MNWREIRTAIKLILIPAYLLALHVAASVLQETFSVFEYGRF